MDKNILKLLNSPVGRLLLGITDNLPIVRFDDSWVEAWTGKFKDGKPLMKATVWTYPRVAKEILIPYEKLKIAQEYRPIRNKEEAFLHYSGLEFSRKYPQIYFSTITKNPSAGEGRQIRNADATFAAARGAASSAANDENCKLQTSVDGTPIYGIQRVCEPFNTSTIGEMTVSAAAFQFYRDDSLQTFANESTTSIEICPSQQANPASAVAADYSTLTFTSRGTLNLASTTNAQYNSVTITDFTEISGIAYTKYMAITGLDLSNTAPGANKANIMSWQIAGAANPPKLDLTYTLTAVPSGATYNHAFFM